MPFVSIIFGLLLVGLGAQGYYDFHEVLGVQKHQPTALIPAYFGAALVLLGLIAMAGGAVRKHAMHLAAMVGLVGFVGGIYRPFKALADKSFDFKAFDFSNVPTKLQLIMAGLCISFVLLCVQSFMAARRRRAERGDWPE